MVNEVQPPTPVTGGVFKHGSCDIKILVFNKVYLL
jgi:hypothetical protein